MHYKLFKSSELILLLSIALFTAIPLLSFSQTDSVYYKFNLIDEPKIKFQKNLYDSFPSSLLDNKLKEVFNFFYESGYLLANIDDKISCSGVTCILNIKAGPQFVISELSNGNIPKELLRSINYDEIILKNRIFSIKDISKLRNKLLQHCENNGFPFASVYFDSILADRGSLKADIFLDFGPQILFDSINITSKTKNKAKISSKFISSYLGIKKGSSYDESQVYKIDKRLKELPFLNIYKSSQILFKGNIAYPILFLENRRASRFDVIFGFLPNANPLPGQRRFNFTGNVNIDLLNSFGRGERLFAQWQQFQVGRSELKLGFNLPYLLGSPIGISSKFELYRRDSTYVDIIADIGMSYLFNGNNFLKLFWKNSSTNVQNFNLNNIIQSRNLPNILDVRNNSIGIEYYYQGLDYRFNPLKGFELNFEGSVGFKYIKKNNSIVSLIDPIDPNFSFSSLYDSLTLNSIQYNLRFSYAHFFNLWRQLTLMVRYRTAAVINSQSEIFQNELIRLGGQQLMRGFDEQSIFGNWYNIISTELRYILNQNSYAFIFSDLGYVQTNNSSPNSDLRLYGFGIGLALETKVGIFGLSYALGSNFDNPIILRNGKIHFGYINMF